MKRFSYKNVMQVPRLEKIAINIGVGQATQDAKLVEAAAKDLEAIVGQKVVITRAKKSISNFKLREKMPIGCRVTLRRTHMYEFLDRFISVTVPRIRDFRGLSDTSFDGRGNYTIGIKEHTVFPEIDVDKIARIFGMDITFVTTAQTDQEALRAAEGLRHAVREAAGSTRNTESIIRTGVVQRMAKTSSKARQAKRERLVAKYAALRKELKEKGDYDALQKLPRNSSPTRLHNRCIMTGRPRGVHAQVRHLPDRLPRARARREDPRRHARRAGSGRYRLRSQCELQENDLMTMTDPVADYLTRLRNALQAGHKRVDVPASNLKRS